MKFADIIAAIVAALGLAAALEGYINAEFSTKLIALAVIATLVLFAATRRLTNWVKVRVSAGLTGRRPRRSRLKMFFSVVAIVLLAVAVPLTAYLVTTFYALNMAASKSDDEGGVWLSAARPIATKVTLLVPSQAKGFDCRPVGGDHPAQTTMLEWDGTDPHLQIINFKSPQAQGVICRPAARIDQFRPLVEPAAVEVLLPQQRSKYQLVFSCSGGLLCLGNLIYFFLRSR